MKHSRDWNSRFMFFFEGLQIISSSSLIVLRMLCGFIFCWERWQSGTFTSQKIRSSHRGCRRLYQYHCPRSSSSPTLISQLMAMCILLMSLTSHNFCSLYWTSFWFIVSAIILFLLFLKWWFRRLNLFEISPHVFLSVSKGLLLF